MKSIMPSASAVQMNTGAASASSRKRASFSDACRSASSSRSRSCSRRAAARSRSTAAASVLAMPWRKFTSSSEKSSSAAAAGRQHAERPALDAHRHAGGAAHALGSNTGEGVKRVSVARSGDTTGACLAQRVGQLPGIVGRQLVQHLGGAGQAHLGAEV